MAEMNFAKRVEEMEALNPIPVLDDLNMLTRNMIADYLHVANKRIINFCGRHQDELDALGARKVYSDELENMGYMLNASNGRRTYSKGDCSLIMGNAFDYVHLYTKECVALIDDVFHNPKSENRKQRKQIADPVQGNHAGEDLHVQPLSENAMQIFSNETFGSIRTIMRDGEPWFVAADVCKALEINNNRDAISRLDDDEKGVVLTDTPGGKQNTTIINEPGLYTLVLGSRKPEAKAFKRWITHDVIPSLRKNGAYIMGQESLSEKELIAKALIACNRIVEKQKVQISQLQNENSILLAKANTWDYPSIINALMRKYAASCCGGRFETAWTELYRKIRYKHHIDVKRRRNETGKGYFKCISANEMPIVAQVAAAMCGSAGLDVAIIINSVNAEKVS